MMMHTGGKSFRNPHNLPVKTCEVCNRPFTWRKKWERCWDEVRTCSNSCKAQRRARKPGATVLSGIAASAVATSTARKGCKAQEDSGTDTDVESHEQLNEQEAVSDSSYTFSSSPQQELINISQEEDPAFAKPLTPAEERRARKKALKKAKQAKRAGSPEAVAAKMKPCDVCLKRVNVLIRCTCDASQRWRMLCGRCWKEASGGVPDGNADHPHYRYGGLWKNRAADVSLPRFTSTHIVAASTHNATALDAA